VAIDFQVIERCAGVVEKQGAGASAVVLVELHDVGRCAPAECAIGLDGKRGDVNATTGGGVEVFSVAGHAGDVVAEGRAGDRGELAVCGRGEARSEEHTSEL